MAVYRGMDIGTATPREEELEGIAHHMLSTVGPEVDYTLSDFQRDARQVVAEIQQRNKRALLVGGTGLYVRAVIDPFDIPPQFPGVRSDLEARDTEALEQKLAQLDPLGASRVPSGNRRRLIRALEVTIGAGKPFSTFGPGMNEFPRTNFRQIGIWLPRSRTNQLIESRIDEMIDAGWIDETALLANQSWSRTARQAIGYKQWQQYLAGEIAFDAARDEVVAATRSFSRKQRMWFRRDPRIGWFGTAQHSAHLFDALVKDCEIWLANSD